MPEQKFIFVSCYTMIANSKRNSAIICRHNYKLSESALKLLQVHFLGMNLISPTTCLSSRWPSSSAAIKKKDLIPNPMRQSDAAKTTLEVDVLSKREARIKSPMRRLGLPIMKIMLSSSATTALSRFSLLRSTVGRSVSRTPPIPLFLSPKTRSKDFRRLRLFSMASETKESTSNNPGLATTPDEATRGYFLQQTMFRIKDPKVSLDFYSRVLGMSLLKRLDFPEMKFSLYFMGYEDLSSAPADAVDRTVWTFRQKATMELTHNWGTESDPEFKGYHNGNSEPRGFGHIGITVDDAYEACARFESLGVEFVKRPDDGKMKGVAFIKDPDGYWIEIFDLKVIRQLTANSG